MKAQQQYNESLVGPPELEEWLGEQADRIAEQVDAPFCIRSWCVPILRGIYLQAFDDARMRTTSAKRDE